MELNIIPFAGVNQQDLLMLRADLEPFGYESRIAHCLDMPETAYNLRRGKYVADDLLSFLTQFDGSRVLGVIHRDMYRYVLDYIRGFADLPGRVALISLARLYDTVDRKLIRNRIRNLALHELGHTCGLEHCRQINCIMYSGKYELDLGEVECYCERCKSKLVVSV